jgi:hypothetical protein
LDQSDTIFLEKQIVRLDELGPLKKPGSSQRRVGRPPHFFGKLNCPAFCRKPLRLFSVVSIITAVLTFGHRQVNL